MKHARSFLSACFFLCGIACFASIPWIQRHEWARFAARERFYASPVPLYTNRLLMRNDVFGKGRFGATRGNHSQRRHKGIDLLTALSNPITAAKSGRVYFAGLDKGYGWYVEIHHPDGRLTRYAHLSRIFVSAGDWVASGQRVGLCGKSGNADDARILPHLHFEIREGETPVDPSKLFDPKILINIS